MVRESVLGLRASLIGQVRDLLRGLPSFFSGSCVECAGARGALHTGGVPGRHEIDNTQELNYAAVAKAIVDLGFQGYMAHEFVPKAKDPIKSLDDAAKLCDV